jgi:hypothetical protein
MRLTKRDFIPMVGAGSAIGLLVQAAPSHRKWLGFIGVG